MAKGRYGIEYQYESAINRRDRILARIEILHERISLLDMKAGEGMERESKRLTRIEAKRNSYEAKISVLRNKVKDINAHINALEKRIA